MCPEGAAILPAQGNALWIGIARKVHGRSNGPTIHRELGERLARWAVFIWCCSSSQGVALGCEKTGPSAQIFL